MTRKQRTRHEAGSTEVLGRGQHYKGFDGNYSKNVIRIFPQAKKSCTGCGIRFTPFKPWHRLCRTCFGYHRAGQHLALAAQLLKGLK
jgi:hypothetical protein